MINKEPIGVLKNIVPQNYVASEDYVPLSCLSEHQEGVVAMVNMALRGLKKFTDVGLINGTRVKFQGRAPFGGLIRVRVLNSSLSLHSEDAAHIMIRRGVE